MTAATTPRTTPIASNRPVEVALCRVEREVVDTEPGDTPHHDTEKDQPRRIADRPAPTRSRADASARHAHHRVQNGEGERPDRNPPERQCARTEIVRSSADTVRRSGRSAAPRLFLEIRVSVQQLDQHSLVDRVRHGLSDLVPRIPQDRRERVLGIRTGGEAEGVELNWDPWHNLCGTGIRHRVARQSSESCRSLAPRRPSRRRRSF